MLVLLAHTEQLLILPPELRVFPLVVQNNLVITLRVFATLALARELALLRLVERRRGIGVLDIFHDFIDDAIHGLLLVDFQ